MQPPGCRLSLQQANGIHRLVSRETSMSDKSLYTQILVVQCVQGWSRIPAFHVKRVPNTYGIGETFTRRLSPLPSLSVVTPEFSERYRWTTRRSEEFMGGISTVRRSRTARRAVLWAIPCIASTRRWRYPSASSTTRLKKGRFLNAETL